MACARRWTSRDEPAGGSRVNLLSVNELRKRFPLKKDMRGRGGGTVHAVDDISFELAEGETLGVVGESGCGKSTTARLLMRLIEPDAGEIRLEGRIIGSHLKDLHEFGPGGHDMVYGQGFSDVPAILNEFKRQGFTGPISIEYEYKQDNNLPEVTQCIAFVRDYKTK